MNETWYTEIWTNEDLEAALENAGIPTTDYAVEKLKGECLHLFDDKSARNEMLADKVYELQYADKGFFIQPLATSIEELITLRSYKTNWGFSGTKSRLMLNTLTGMVLISMYNADTEKWSVETSDHTIIIPEDEILKNVISTSSEDIPSVELTKTVYRWCEAKFRTAIGEATAEDAEYLNSILRHQKTELYSLILREFYGDEVGQKRQDDNDEHQAIIDLPNGRFLQVRHVKDALPKDRWFFSWMIHCSEQEFKKGKYDSTCGIVDAKTTHDFNKAICEEMAEWCFKEENTETPLDPENPPKTLIKVKKMFRMPYHKCFQKTYALDLEPGRAANKEQAIRFFRTNVCLDEFDEDKIQEIIICPNCGAKTTVQNGFVYCYDCEWEAPIDMLQVNTEEEKS